jgi:hypothetical protein
LEDSTKAENPLISHQFAQAFHYELLPFQQSSTAQIHQLNTLHYQQSLCVYVYNGKAIIADKVLNVGQLGVFSDSGKINLYADSSSDLKCIIVGGEKLNEPVARGGPFVMNTKAEVLKAFSDYQEGILTD